MSSAVVRNVRPIMRGRIVGFLRAGSIEVSTLEEELLPSLAAMLPGRTVYVAPTPADTLDDVVRVAIRAQTLGLRASPHIAARSLEGEHRLRGALRELVDAGIEQVLLVAGNRDRPIGKFDNTLQVLETGAMVDAGILSVAIAGYPQGHRSIGPQRLQHALRAKQAFARRTGTQMHIVSQFCFDPEAIWAWVAHLPQHGVTLPVHVGIAGPTPLPKLIKLSMDHGAATSVGSLVRSLSAASHVPSLALGPDEMVTGLLQYDAVSHWPRVVCPHFFSFGGAMATANWMRAVVDGRFELQADSDRFRMSV